MKRSLYIGIGLLATTLGTIGIFVPGIPTTPLILLASFCFIRSSNRLYTRLHASFLGKYIENYQNGKGVPLRTKVISLMLMCSMVGISIIYFIPHPIARIAVGISALIGCYCILFLVPTQKKTNINNP